MAALFQMNRFAGMCASLNCAPLFAAGGRGARVSTRTAGVHMLMPSTDALFLTAAVAKQFFLHLIGQGTKSARTGDRSPGCRPGDRGQCRDAHRPIHIHNKPRCLSRGFFFGCVSATLAICASTPPPVVQSCRHADLAYSPGALTLMGRVEKTCTLVNGAPTWVRG